MNSGEKLYTLDEQVYYKGKRKTPFEAWSGRKAYVNFKVFVSICNAYIPNETTR